MDDTYEKYWAVRAAARTAAKRLGMAADAALVAVGTPEYQAAKATMDSASTELDRASAELDRAFAELDRADAASRPHAVR